MVLATSRKKRFQKINAHQMAKETKSSKPLLFVVQKHYASHLHYDFRLELDGVLLSWAVPKRLSLNPSDRHLAIQMEDHPYNYKDFEGIIPKGNYGAGKVTIWDKGSYHWQNIYSRNESEKAMRHGVENGHLKIHLDGQKLQGLFHVIRMKNTSWLIIKSNK
jgi:bifunctional non-homologous end joining protein LigD